MVKFSEVRGFSTVQAAQDFVVSNVFGHSGLGMGC